MPPVYYYYYNSVPGRPVVNVEHASANPLIFIIFIFIIIIILAGAEPQRRVVFSLWKNALPEREEAVEESQRVIDWELKEKGGEEVDMRDGERSVASFNTVLVR